VSDGTLEYRVEQVRSFNRFFTRKIGVLNEGLLQSPYSLTEARVLFELATRLTTTASAISRELGLDPGYLSRILARFEEQGLTERFRSDEDGRQFFIRLTTEGRNAFSLLNQRSQDEVATMLSDLSDADQQKLLKAMHDIRRILGDKSVKGPETFVLRDPRPGDMGWVIHRHGALYAKEYGWDERFEVLVARIVAEFIDNYKPRRERCIIAELDGESAGCAFLVQRSETDAQLRLLLVEPEARGLGLGTRLVRECVTFAKQAGYQRIVLWTANVLTQARRIYSKAGFRVIEEEAQHRFGKDLIFETWELIL